MKNKRITFGLLFMVLLLMAGCGEKEMIEEETKESTKATVELSDTIRWFNATHAVLTQLNGFDYNIFAGIPLNIVSKEMQKLSLKHWWNVTDCSTAEETLDWVLEEGHRG